MSLEKIGPGGDKPVRPQKKDKPCLYDLERTKKAVNKAGGKLELIADINIKPPSCRRKNLPKIKFTAEERKILTSFSPNDLLVILDRKASELEGSLFLHLYEKTAADAKKTSLNEFKNSLQGKTPDELLDLIETHVTEDSSLTRTIRKKIKLLLSEKFKVLKSSLSNFSFIKESDLSDENIMNTAFNHIDLITKELDSGVYINTLQSKEFKDFLTKMQNGYGIDVSDKIKEMTDLYFDPEKLSFLNSENTLLAVKLIKKHFPDLKFKDTVSLFTLERFTETLDKNEIKNSIEQKTYYHKKFTTLYNAPKVKTVYGLVELLNCEQYKLEKLAEPEAMDQINYVKDNYPETFAFNLNESHDFIDAATSFIEELNRLKLTARELDSFLNLFSDNIGNHGNIGCLGMANITGDQIKNIMKDNGNFKKYLNEIKEKYPSLSLKGNLSVIKKLVLNYGSIDKLHEMNRYMKAHGLFSKNGSQVALNLDNYDLKMKVIQFVAQKKFDKFLLHPQQNVLSYSKLPCLELNKPLLSVINEKITSGDAEKLYETLTNSWNLTRININDFLYILATGEDEFYLNTGNASKFHALKQTYNILSNNTGTDKIESLEDMPKSQLELLINKSDYLSDKHVKENFFKVYREYVKYCKGKPGIKLQDIAHIDPLEILKDESLGKILSILKEKYDIRGIRYETNKLPGNTGQFLTDLEDEKTLELFNKISKEQDSNFNSLLVAINIKNNPENLEIYNMLNKLDPDKSTYQKDQFIGYFLNSVLGSKSVMANLENKDFIHFCNKIFSHFYSGIKSALFIQEISTLYDEIKNNPQHQELLFSEKFNEAFSYVKNKFNITRPDPSVLSPVLKIAEKFDPAKLDSFIEKIGEPVYANDLVLVSAVLNNPEYEKLLFNKDKMLEEMEKILSQTPAPRQILSFVEEIKSRSEYHYNKAYYDKIIESYTNSHTEKPDLKTFPKIQLLRLVLLKKALKNKDFLNDMGRIAYDDINDTTCEHGGNIYFENGQLRLADLKSAKTSDVSYYHPQKLYFTSGIMTFHCHMKAPPGNNDTSKFSGPSGYLGIHGGDIGSSEPNNATDIVITKMGHPKDKNGNEDLSKMIVNIDLYFIDKRKPEKHELIIFDMGNRIINLPEKPQN
ncbi:MAG: hypothetical protein ABIH00_04445 [Armatimonadota bacterium]